MAPNEWTADAASGGIGHPESRQGSVHAGRCAMSAGALRPGEVYVDVAVVRRLIAAQFPQWTDLPVTPVARSGVDNATYRLGEDMSVRLPRLPRWVGQVEREQRWLPRLAPHLPLAVPVPLAKRAPGEGYPFRGRSIGGSTARTRPWSAPPIHARQGSTWRASSPPCSASIRPAGHRPSGATGSAACPWATSVTPRSWDASAGLDPRRPCSGQHAGLRRPAQRRHRLRHLGRGRSRVRPHRRVDVPGRRNSGRIPRHALIADHQHNT